MDPINGVEFQAQLYRRQNTRQWVAKIMAHTVCKFVELVISFLKLVVSDSQNRIGNEKFLGFFDRRDDLLLYPWLTYESENVPFIYRINHRFQIGVGR